MTDDRNVTELDVLAYVDGHLDHDPARRAALRRAIACDPVLAARVRDYEAQNEALRRAYGPRAAEPVPERLREVLSRGRERFRVRTFARAAAVLLLAASTGVGGWFLGRTDGPVGGWRAAALFAEARDVLAAGAGGGFVSVGTPPSADIPVNWFSDEVALTVRAPDLSGQGFQLAGKGAVAFDERRAVRFVYTGRDGADLVLFMRPRWSNGELGLTVSEDAGLSLATWRDGPLSMAMVGPLEPERARALAEAVRRGMRAHRTAIRPSVPVPNGPVSIGSAAPNGAGAPDSGVLPRPPLTGEGGIPASVAN